MNGGRACASEGRKSGLGASQLKRTVVSSSTSNVGSLPPASMKGLGVGVSSVLVRISSYQYRKSSEVNGVPSDHLCPSRRWRVKTRPSSSSTAFRMSGCSA